nr:hypothetical protein CPGR_03236 [Mycolicibacterium fortuitum subsp. fortuitum DSM 46621 = ATCC 6841 = JCM 6387]
MPKKNGIGSGPAVNGMSGCSHLSSRGMPGTSMPIRFTISWNIRLWLHSSIDSCRQYRYSGDPLGTQNEYSIRPRIRMFSNCSPTLATLAWRHMPIAICRSIDCAWYHA